MPFRNGRIVPNATVWNTGMISFLKDNYQRLTNLQLANALGLRLTVTRNKLRELGFKRIEMEYWNNQMVLFLKENYQKKGDVELAEIFERKFPKNKKWTKNHINKKRKYLALIRTTQEVNAIASANSSPGGKSFTISSNSSSLHMHPSWVVQCIAWRNKDLQQELLKEPELIEAAKALIRLKRIVKKSKQKE